MSESYFPTHELEQLLEKFREAQARADERAKVTHERFNVFTTLLKAHDEVRLHTRFLHCLLNPAEGTHDCGVLFLNLFFTTLKERPGLDNDGKEVLIDFPHTDKPWTVEKEASRADFGRIDILLERQKFGIAIENKINHGEGDEQLARYASYIEERHGDGLVIFLTLDGRQGVTHEGRIRCIRISYADHILIWLEKCLRETHDIIPINQVLQQYRAVVRNLTGQNLDTKAMKEISDFIIENPDIIRFREQLEVEIKNAVANFFSHLADEIKNELREFQVRRHEQWVFGVSSKGALVLKTPNNMPFDIYIEYAPDEDVLCVGISGDFENQPPSSEQRDLFDRMYEKLIAKGYPDYRPNTNWPTGWLILLDELDDDGIAGLLKKTAPKTAFEVCGKIRDYIAQLEKFYNEVKKPTKVLS